MPRLRNIETGQLEFVPDELMAAAVQSGDYEIAPTERVPVATPAGTIVPAPAESVGHARRILGATPATPEQVARERREARLEQKHGGVLGGLQTGFEQAVDVAGFGLPSLIARGIAPRYLERVEEREEVHPAPGLVGTGVGLVGPALLTGGGGAGAAIAGKTAGGLATRAGTAIAGRAGGKLGGRVLGATAEGAIIGGVTAAQEIARFDDPLTVEQIAASLSSNVLIGGGGGVAAAVGGTLLEKSLLRGKQLVGAARAKLAEAGPVSDDIAEAAASGDTDTLIAIQTAEKETLKATQATQKAAVAEEVTQYHQAVEEARIPRVTAEEQSKVYVDARDTIRRATDEPIGLRERPEKVLDPIRRQAHVLEKTIHEADATAATLAKEEARIADDIGKEMRAADRAKAEGAAKEAAAAQTAAAKQVTASAKAELRMARADARLQRAETTLAKAKSRADRQAAQAGLKVAKMEAEAARKAMPAAAPAEAAVARALDLDDLDDFADEVNRVATELETIPGGQRGLYGDRKAFIASVRDMDPVFENMPAEEFARKLTEANRKGLVRLSRADLVGEMNPHLVKASELGAGGARFHFIERGMPTRRAAAGAEAPAAVGKIAAAAEPETILIKGRAARRYGDWADKPISHEHTTKGINIQRGELEEFVQAIKSGETAAKRAQTLQGLPALLEQNKALQQKILNATKKTDELTSPRLEEAIKAHESLKVGGKRGLGEQLLQGAVYQGVAQAVTPILPDRLKPLAPILAGAASLKATGGVFGRMGRASGKMAARTSGAVESFLTVGAKSAKAVQRVAPVVASKVLTSVRYAPPEEKRPPEPREPAPRKEDSALYKAFHAREKEIRSQIIMGPDGKPMMRPEARARVAELLAAVQAQDPQLADQLETSAARRLEFLGSKLPQKPDFGFQVGPDGWRPSDMQMREFARYAAAVEDPAAIFERASNGTTTPEDAEVAQKVYPEMLAKFKGEIVAGMALLRQILPPQRRLALSILTGIPVDPALVPSVLPILQAQHTAEEGTEGGTEAPPAMPQGGSVKKTDEPTPAQQRAG